MIVHGPRIQHHGPSLDEALARSLEALERGGMRRTLRTMGPRCGAEISWEGKTLIDFSSNDYLGLASHPTLLRAATGDGVEVGVGAARLISGNRVDHMRLEEELARFNRREAAIVFGSGFLANMGALSALADHRDVIYADRLNHASLIDGCRLSRAEVRVYPHGDTGALASMMNQDDGRYVHRWIVTDGVFSMDGDLAPLPALIVLARAHGAWLYVDDAHGTGILGATGRGVAEHFGVEAEIDVLMGTLGKALGTMGAFVVGSATLVEFLRQRARTFVFTTGTPAGLAAAAREALRLVDLRSDLRDRLRANTLRLRTRLAERGHLPPGVPDTPIVPVLLGGNDRTMRVASALGDRGWLVGAIRPPTVPAGSSRLRVTLSAAHTPEQIDGLAEALESVLGDFPAP